MRGRLLTAGAIVCAVLAPPCEAQAGAGGDGSFVVTFTQTTQLSKSKLPPVVQVMRMRMRVRDGRARIDYAPDTVPTSSPSMYLLYDARAGRTMFVTPELRRYWVLESVSVDTSMRGLPDGASERYSQVTGHRDSPGQGESVFGFRTQPFRAGMGYTMQIDGTVTPFSARVDIESESQVSPDISALDPGFTVFGTGLTKTASAPGTDVRDTAMARVGALMSAPPGFPVRQITTTRTIISGDTTVTTVTLRMTSFARGGVGTADLILPDGYTETDVIGTPRVMADSVKAMTKP